MTLWPENLTILSNNKIAQASSSLINKYKKLLHSESIPFSATNTTLLKELYIPLADWVSRKNHQPYILGINGAQGSGKTTFSKILKMVIENLYHRSVVIISLDDFYLSKSDRQILGETVHPLLSTRGVPGTHDTARIINFLNSIDAHQFPLTIPIFDKSIDDQKNQSEWKTITNKPDVILFEGWCMGATAENEISLQAPINTLEINEDNNSHWRTYVNQQLNNDYQEIFSHLDGLISLKVPSFDMVLPWRELQEEKLRSSIHAQENQCMSQQQLQRFIMLFERITRRMLEETPKKPTFTLELNNEHQIENCIYNANN